MCYGESHNKGDEGEGFTAENWLHINVIYLLQCDLLHTSGVISLCFDVHFMFILRNGKTVEFGIVCLPRTRTRYHTNTHTHIQIHSLTNLPLLLPLCFCIIVANQLYIHGCVWEEYLEELSQSLSRITQPFYTGVT